MIAMLKTNRILYPKGIAIQAKQFAHYIEPKDTHLVTVGEELIGCIATKGLSKVSMMP
ncbi:hypothetical protein HNR34_003729 [Geobacillus subterraneus]